MEPAIRLGVGRQSHAIAHLLGEPEVIAESLLELVRVDELLSRVVRRVDIDHLYPAVVALLDKFEHLEVVPLDERVSRGVEVD
jgi:hypothetical protein